MDFKNISNNEKKPFRSRYSLWFRSISLVIIVAFLLQDFASAQGGTPLWSEVAQSKSTDVKSPDAPRQISIPVDAGLTRKVVAKAGNDVIINIQDAHSKLGAQESIVTILDNLVRNYDLNLIALEGASDLVDTSLVSSFPIREVRERTGKFLLKEGKISAGEFYSMISEKPVTLYGVDDPELYKGNLEAFKNLVENKLKIRNELKALKQVLHELEVRAYSEELLDLADHKLLHKNGEIKFTEYWERFSSLARSKNVDYTRYVNLKKLADTVELEKEIDFKKAQSERDALIEELGRKLPKPELEQLVFQSLQFKQNKLTPGTFHYYLGRISQGAGLDPMQYKNVILYSRYVVLYEDIDLVAIFDEVENFENELREKLFKNEDERKLAAIIHCATILSALLDTTLTDKDYAFFVENSSSCEIAAIREELGPLAMKYRLTMGERVNFDLLEKMVPSAREFYRLAEARNKALLENTMKRMKSEDVHLAALITGGFHSEGIASLMDKEKLSYLVVMPKFEDKSPDRPYIAILTQKPKEYEAQFKDSDFYLAADILFSVSQNIDSLTVEEKDYLLKHVFVNVIVNARLFTGSNLSPYVKATWLAVIRQRHEELRATGKTSLISPERLEKWLDSFRLQKVGGLYVVTFKEEDVRFEVLLDSNYRIMDIRTVTTDDLHESLGISEAGIEKIGALQSQIDELQDAVDTLRAEMGTKPLPDQALLESWLADAEHGARETYALLAKKMALEDLRKRIENHIMNTVENRVRRSGQRPPESLPETVSKAAARLATELQAPSRIQIAAARLANQPARPPQERADVSLSATVEHALMEQPVALTGARLAERISPSQFFKEYLNEASLQQNKVLDAQNKPLRTRSDVLAYFDKHNPNIFVRPDGTAVLETMDEIDIVIGGSTGRMAARDREGNIFVIWNGKLSPIDAVKAELSADPNLHGHLIEDISSVGEFERMMLKRLDDITNSMNWQKPGSYQRLVIGTPGILTKDGQIRLANVFGIDKLFDPKEPILRSLRARGWKEDQLPEILVRNDMDLATRALRAPPDADYLHLSLGTGIGLQYGDRLSFEVGSLPHIGDPQNRTIKQAYFENRKSMNAAEDTLFLETPVLNILKLLGLRKIVYSGGAFFDSENTDVMRNLREFFDKHGIEQEITKIPEKLKDILGALSWNARDLDTEPGVFHTELRERFLAEIEAKKEEVLMRGIFTSYEEAAAWLDETNSWTEKEAAQWEEWLNAQDASVFQKGSPQRLEIGLALWESMRFAYLSRVVMDRPLLADARILDRLNRLEHASWTLIEKYARRHLKDEKLASWAGTYSETRSASENIGTVVKAGARLAGSGASEKWVRAGFTATAILIVGGMIAAGFLGIGAIVAMIGLAPVVVTAMQWWIYAGIFLIVALGAGFYYGFRSPPLQSPVKDVFEEEELRALLDGISDPQVRESVESRIKEAGLMAISGTLEKNEQKKEEEGFRKDTKRARNVLSMAAGVVTGGIVLLLAKVSLLALPATLVATAVLAAIVAYLLAKYVVAEGAYEWYESQGKSRGIKAIYASMGFFKGTFHLVFMFYHLFRGFVFGYFERKIRVFWFPLFTYGLKFFKGPRTTFRQHISEYTRKWVSKTEVRRIVVTESKKAGSNRLMTDKAFRNKYFSFSNIVLLSSAVKELVAKRWALYVAGVIGHFLLGIVGTGMIHVPPLAAAFFGISATISFGAFAWVPFVAFAILVMAAKAIRTIQVHGKIRAQDWGALAIFGVVFLTLGFFGALHPGGFDILSLGLGEVHTQAFWIFENGLPMVLTLGAFAGAAATLIVLHLKDIENKTRGKFLHSFDKYLKDGILREERYQQIFKARYPSVDKKKPAPALIQEFSVNAAVEFLEAKDEKDKLLLTQQERAQVRAALLKVLSSKQVETFGLVGISTYQKELLLDYLQEEERAELPESFQVLEKANAFGLVIASLWETLASNPYWQKVASGVPAMWGVGTEVAGALGTLEATHFTPAITLGYLIDRDWLEFFPNVFEHKLPQLVSSFVDSISAQAQPPSHGPPTAPEPRTSAPTSPPPPPDTPTVIPGRVETITLPPDTHMQPEGDEAKYIEEVLGAQQRWENLRDQMEIVTPDSPTHVIYSVDPRSLFDISKSLSFRSTAEFNRFYNRPGVRFETFVPPDNEIGRDIARIAEWERLSPEQVRAAIENKTNFYLYFTWTDGTGTHHGVLESGAKAAREAAAIDEAAKLSLERKQHGLAILNETDPARQVELMREHLGFEAPPGEQRIVGMRWLFDENHNITGVAEIYRYEEIEPRVIEDENGIRSVLAIDREGQPDIFLEHWPHDAQANGYFFSDRATLDRENPDPAQGGQILFGGDYLRAKVSEAELTVLMAERNAEDNAEYKQYLGGALVLDFLSPFVPQFAAPARLIHNAVESEGQLSMGRPARDAVAEFFSQRRAISPEAADLDLLQTFSEGYQERFWAHDEREADSSKINFGISMVGPALDALGVNFESRIGPDGTIYVLGLPSVGAVGVSGQSLANMASGGVADEDGTLNEMPFPMAPESPRLTIPIFSRILDLRTADQIDDANDRDSGVLAYTARGNLLSSRVTTLDEFAFDVIPRMPLRTRDGTPVWAISTDGGDGAQILNLTTEGAEDLLEEARGDHEQYQAFLSTRDAGAVRFTSAAGGTPAQKTPSGLMDSFDHEGPAHFGRGFTWDNAIAAEDARQNGDIAVTERILDFYSRYTDTQEEIGRFAGLPTAFDVYRQTPSPGEGPGPVGPVAAVGQVAQRYEGDAVRRENYDRMVGHFAEWLRGKIDSLNHTEPTALVYAFFNADPATLAEAERVLQRVRTHFWDPQARLFRAGAGDVRFAADSQSRWWMTGPGNIAALLGMDPDQVQEHFLNIERHFAVDAHYDLPGGTVVAHSFDLVDIADRGDPTDPDRRGEGGFPEVTKEYEALYRDVLAPWFREQGRADLALWAEERAAFYHAEMERVKAANNGQLPQTSRPNMDTGFIGTSPTGRSALASNIQGRITDRRGNFLTGEVLPGGQTFERTPEVAAVSEEDFTRPRHVPGEQAMRDAIALRNDLTQKAFLQARIDANLPLTEAQQQQWTRLSARPERLLNANPDGHEFTYRDAQGRNIHVVIIFSRAERQVTSDRLRQAVERAETMRRTQAEGGVVFTQIVEETGGVRTPGAPLRIGTGSGELERVLRWIARQSPTVRAAIAQRNFSNFEYPYDLNGDNRIDRNERAYATLFIPRHGEFRYTAAADGIETTYVSRDGIPVQRITRESITTITTDPRLRLENRTETRANLSGRLDNPRPGGLLYETRTLRVFLDTLRNRLAGILEPRSVVLEINHTNGDQLVNTYGKSDKPIRSVNLVAGTVANITVDRAGTVTTRVQHLANAGAFRDAVRRGTYVEPRVGAWISTETTQRQESGETQTRRLEVGRIQYADGRVETIWRDPAHAGRVTRSESGDRVSTFEYSDSFLNGRVALRVHVKHKDTGAVIEDWTAVRAHAGTGRVIYHVEKATGQVRYEMTRRAGNSLRLTPGLAPNTFYVAERDLTNQVGDRVAVRWLDWDTLEADPSSTPHSFLVRRAPVRFGGQTFSAMEIQDAQGRPIETQLLGSDGKTGFISADGDRIGIRREGQPNTLSLKQVIGRSYRENSTLAGYDTYEFDGARRAVVLGDDGRPKFAGYTLDGAVSTLLFEALGRQRTLSEQERREYDRLRSLQVLSQASAVSIRFESDAAGNSRFVEAQVFADSPHPIAVIKLDQTHPNILARWMRDRNLPLPMVIDVKDYGPNAQDRQNGRTQRSHTYEYRADDGTIGDREFGRSIRTSFSDLFDNAVFTPQNQARLDVLERRDLIQGEGRLTDVERTELNDLRSAKVRVSLNDPENEFFWIYNNRTGVVSIQVFNKEHRDIPIARMDNLTLRPDGSIERADLHISYFDGEGKVEREEVYEVAGREVGFLSASAYRNEELRAQLETLARRLSELGFPALQENLENVVLFDIQARGVNGEGIAKMDTVGIFNNDQQLVKIDWLRSRVTLNYFDPNNPSTQLAGVDYYFTQDEDHPGRIKEILNRPLSFSVALDRFRTFTVNIAQGVGMIEGRNSYGVMQRPEEGEYDESNRLTEEDFGRALELIRHVGEGQNHQALKDLLMEGWNVTRRQVYGYVPDEENPPHFFRADGSEISIDPRYARFLAGYFETLGVPATTLMQFLDLETPTNEDGTPRFETEVASSSFMANYVFTPADGRVSHGMPVSGLYLESYVSDIGVDERTRGAHRFSLLAKNEAGFTLATYHLRPNDPAASLKERLKNHTWVSSDYLYYATSALTGTYNEPSVIADRSNHTINSGGNQFVTSVGNRVDTGNGLVHYAVQSGFSTVPFLPTSQTAAGRADLYRQATATVFDGDRGGTPNHLMYSGRQIVSQGLPYIYADYDLEDLNKTDNYISRGRTPTFITIMKNDPRLAALSAVEGATAFRVPSHYSEAQAFDTQNFRFGWARQTNFSHVGIQDGEQVAIFDEDERRQAQRRLLQTQRRLSDNSLFSELHGGLRGRDAEIRVYFSDIGLPHHSQVLEPVTFDQRQRVDHLVAFIEGHRGEYYVWGREQAPWGTIGPLETPLGTVNFNWEEFMEGHQLDASLLEDRGYVVLTEEQARHLAEREGRRYALGVPVQSIPDRYTTEDATEAEPGFINFVKDLFKKQIANSGNNGVINNLVFRSDVTAWPTFVALAGAVSLLPIITFFMLKFMVWGLSWILNRLVGITDKEIKTALTPNISPQPQPLPRSQETDVLAAQPIQVLTKKGRPITLTRRQFIEKYLVDFNLMPHFRKFMIEKTSGMSADQTLREMNRHLQFWRMVVGYEMGIGGNLGEARAGKFYLSGRGRQGFYLTAKEMDELFRYANQDGRSPLNAPELHQLDLGGLIGSVLDLDGALYLPHNDYRKLDESQRMLIEMLVREFKKYLFDKRKAAGIRTFKFPVPGLSYHWVAATNFFRIVREAFFGDKGLIGALGAVVADLLTLLKKKPASPGPPQNLAAKERARLEAHAKIASRFWKWDILLSFTLAAIISGFVMSFAWNNLPYLLVFLPEAAVGLSIVAVLVLAFFLWKAARSWGWDHKGSFAFSAAVSAAVLVPALLYLPSLTAFLFGSAASLSVQIAWIIGLLLLLLNARMLFRALTYLHLNALYRRMSETMEWDKVKNMDDVRKYLPEMLSREDGPDAYKAFIDWLYLRQAGQGQVQGPTAPPEMGPMISEEVYLKLEEVLSNPDLAAKLPALGDEEAQEYFVSWVNMFLMEEPAPVTEDGHVHPVSIIFNVFAEYIDQRWDDEHNDLDTTVSRGGVEGFNRGLPLVETKFQRVKDKYKNQWRYLIDELTGGLALSKERRDRLFDKDTSADDSLAILMGIGLQKEEIRKRIRRWVAHRTQTVFKTIDTTFYAVRIRYEILGRKLHPEFGNEELQRWINSKVQIVMSYAIDNPFVSPPDFKEDLADYLRDLSLRPENRFMSFASDVANPGLVARLGPRFEEADRMDPADFMLVAEASPLSGNKFNGWAQRRMFVRNRLWFELDSGHRVTVGDIWGLPNELRRFENPNLSWLSYGYEVYGTRWGAGVEKASLSEFAYNLIFRFALWLAGAENNVGKGIAIDDRVRGDRSPVSEDTAISNEQHKDGEELALTKRVIIRQSVESDAFTANSFIARFGSPVVLLYLSATFQEILSSKTVPWWKKMVLTWHLGFYPNKQIIQWTNIFVFMSAYFIPWNIYQSVLWPWLFVLILIVAAQSMNATAIEVYRLRQARHSAIPWLESAVLYLRNFWGFFLFYTVYVPMHSSKVDQGLKQQAVFSKTPRSSDAIAYSAEKVYGEFKPSVQLGVILFTLFFLWMPFHPMSLAANLFFFGMTFSWWFSPFLLNYHPNKVVQMGKAFAGIFLSFLWVWRDVVLFFGASIHRLRIMYSFENIADDTVSDPDVKNDLDFIFQEPSITITEKAAHAAVLADEIWKGLSDDQRSTVIEKMTLGQKTLTGRNPKEEKDPTKANPGDLTRVKLNFYLEVESRYLESRARAKARADRASAAKAPATGARLASEDRFLQRHQLERLEDEQVDRVRRRIRFKGADQKLFVQYDFSHDGQSYHVFGILAVNQKISVLQERMRRRMRKIFGTGIVEQEFHEYSLMDIRSENGEDAFFPADRSGEGRLRYQTVEGAPSYEGEHVVLTEYDHKHLRMGMPLPQTIFTVAPAGKQGFMLQEAPTASDLATRGVFETRAIHDLRQRIRKLDQTYEQGVVWELESHRQYRFLQLNILHSSKVGRLSQEMEDLEAGIIPTRHRELAMHILSSDFHPPHVITAQELLDFGGLVHYDSARIIADALGYQAVVSDRKHIDGRPAEYYERSAVFVHPSMKIREEYHSQSEGDPIIGVKLEDKNGRQFFVFTAHLAAMPWQTEERRRQVEHLRAFIERNNPSGLPVMLAGDFNPSSEKETKKMTGTLSGFTDSYRSLNPDAKGFTFSIEKNPIILYLSNRLDLQYTKGFDPKESRLVFDHAPFFTDHSGVLFDGSPSGARLAVRRAHGTAENRLVDSVVENGNKALAYFGAATAGPARYPQNPGLILWLGNHDVRVLDSVADYSNALKAEGKTPVILLTGGSGRGTVYLIRNIIRYIRSFPERFTDWAKLNDQELVDKFQNLTEAEIARVFLTEAEGISDELIVTETQATYTNANYQNTRPIVLDLIQQGRIPADSEAAVFQGLPQLHRSRLTGDLEWKGVPLKLVLLRAYELDFKELFDSDKTAFVQNGVRLLGSDIVNGIKHEGELAIYDRYYPEQARQIPTDIRQAFLNARRDLDELLSRKPEWRDIMDTTRVVLGARLAALAPAGHRIQVQIEGARFEANRDLIVERLGARLAAQFEFTRTDGFSMPSDAYYAVNIDDMDLAESGERLSAVIEALVAVFEKRAAAELIADALGDVDADLSVIQLRARLEAIQLPRPDRVYSILTQGAWRTLSPDGRQLAPTAAQTAARVEQALLTGQPSGGEDGLQGLLSDVLRIAGDPRSEGFAGNAKALIEAVRLRMDNYFDAQLAQLQEAGGSYTMATDSRLLLRMGDSERARYSSEWKALQMELGQRVNFNNVLLVRGSEAGRLTSEEMSGFDSIVHVSDTFQNVSELEPALYKGLYDRPLVFVSDQNGSAALGVRSSEESGSVEAITMHVPMNTETLHGARLSAALVRLAPEALLPGITRGENGLRLWRPMVQFWKEFIQEQIKQVSIGASA